MSGMFDRENPREETVYGEEFYNSDRGDGSEERVELVSTQESCEAGETLLRRNPVRKAIARWRWNNSKPGGLPIYRKMRFFPSVFRQ